LGHIYSGYFLWVFITALGVLQIASAYSRMKGLSFFDRPLFGYLFGAALIAWSFAQFFISSEHSWRNIVQGGQDFRFVVAGTAAAIAATAVIASVVRLKMAHSGSQGIGLEALKETTYLGLLHSRLRRGGNR
jgi:hypothetical protein